MRNRKLAVRRVRRYRIARYPSRHREAKRVASIGRRALRAAAVPAAALGLGAMGGACEGGMTLVGDDPDAHDVVETVDDVADDVTDVVEDTTPDPYDPDSMIGGGRPDGTHYVRYLTEAEGRALIAATVEEATSSPADPCEAPVLADRLQEDQSFSHFDGADTSGVQANVDLLATEIAVELTPECGGGVRPAVGFEFMTDEAGDDEDVSGDPNGLTDAEETYLDGLRDGRRASISALRAADYPYDVVDYGGYVEDYDRARAEELVRQTVRAILDELRRDGLI
jgi:hypothetical protein